MALTLYDCATAPSPRRARILLAEKGVPHQTVQVDLRSGEQFSDAFRAVNPMCTVPALRLDSGRVLTDNAAIAAWLEAAYPQPPLMGTTPEEKAAVASWQWRAEFDGLFAVAEALRNSSPAMAGRALPGPVKRCGSAWAMKPMRTCRLKGRASSPRSAWQWTPAASTVAPCRAWTCSSLRPSAPSA